MASKKYISFFFVVFNIFLIFAKEMISIPEITYTRIDTKGNTQEVTVSPFYMSKYDVTVEEWASYMEESKTSDSKWKAKYYKDNISIEDQIRVMQFSLSENGFITPKTIVIDKGGPIFAISWTEAIKYCNFISEKEGLIPCYEIIGDDIIPEEVRWLREANGYRLPTVAEWQAVSDIYSEKITLDDVKETNMIQNVTRNLKENRYGVVNIIAPYGKFLWDYYFDKYEYTPKSVLDPSGAEQFTPDENAIFMGDPIYESRCISAFFNIKYLSLESFKIKHVDKVTIDMKESATIRLCRNK